MRTVYLGASAQFIHFRPFGIMSGRVPIQGKGAKHTWEEKGVYNGKGGRTAITEIY
jgi:hypothetical protein